MKACIGVLVIVGMLAASGNAAPVSKAQAAKAAATFITKTYPVAADAKVQTVTAAGKSHLGIKKLDPLLRAGQTIGFVATLDPAGYVLLSADDDAPAIKLHSDGGAFENLPPAVLKVLALELAEDLSTLAEMKKTKAPVNPKHSRDWLALSTPENVGTTTDPCEPTPGLLKTKWNQNQPYNQDCPVAAGGPGGRAYAGCNAVALAQIVRYWQYPLAIVQNHTYLDDYFFRGPCWGIHSISDVGMGGYDWANMPNSITTGSTAAETNAVSQLIYHAAVAVDSDFEAGETKASLDACQSALSAYFSFYTGDIIARGALFGNDTLWYYLIKTDIDAGRPIDYSIQATDGNGDDVGHNVVCDGCRNGNEIHLNFGWGGASDCWYNLDSVIDQNYHYNWTSHKAIFGISPRYTYIDKSSTCLFPVGSSVCDGFAGPYTTVSTGIAAPGGGGIFIRGGSYNETPTFNKPLIVKAYDGPVTIGR